MRNYGITVKPRNGQIYLDGISKHTPNSIEYATRNENDKIKSIREKLAILIASNPKDIITDDDISEYGDITSFITAKIDEIVGEIGESFSMLEKLDILDDILFNWKDDDEELNRIAKPEDFSNGDYRNVYPEAVFDEESNAETLNVEFYGKPHLTNSFEEIYASCKKNIDMNSEIVDDIEAKYVGFVDGKLFAKYDGTFAFTSEDAVKAEIKEQMHNSLFSRMNKTYILNESENAKKFFEDVKKYISEEDSKKIDEYISQISAEARNNSLKSISYADIATIHEIINRAFENYCEERIKIVSMKDICKQFGSV